MKTFLRAAATLAAAAILALPLVSCGSPSSPPSSGSGEVTYKCACGKTKTAAASAAAPQ
jgi:hypothetical protein